MYVYIHIHICMYTCAYIQQIKPNRGAERIREAPNVDVRVYSLDISLASLRKSAPKLLQAVQPPSHLALLPLVLAEDPGWRVRKRAT